MCEFETYRAQYCGLCKQLGQDYGIISRFLLNYDLVLLALLADALSGQQGMVKREGCFANPAAKRCMRHDTDGLALASDGLLLLSYHRLRDNQEDEKGTKRFFYGLAHPVMRAKYRKAAKKRPQLETVLAAQMDFQRKLEADGCQSVDEACEPTAQMCAALFAEAGSTEEERRILWRLGLFCGQIVYLLDAAEDFTEDAAKGRYNVFVNQGLCQEEAVAAVQKRCRMAAGEIALCYNLLTLQQYKPLFDNIFFLGLPAGIAAAGQKRTGRRPGHGQIESL